MEIRYKRIPHLAPMALWMGLFAACVAYSIPVIAGFQDLWDFAYLLLLGTFGCWLSLAAYLSGRFLLKQQTVSLSERGLTATYLNKGELIPWEGIQGITTHRGGVLLHLASSNRLKQLFVRPALETRGLNLSPTQLSEAVLGYGSSRGVKIGTVAAN